MQTNNNDLADQERGERIAQRAFDLVEAFLEGRAAIAITREMPKTPAPGMSSTEPSTMIRILMDPRP